ncbi:MAG: haloacid dehalogenase-like hydrolase [Candidatus Lambdaproteobacteria bacterium]|nr:haloacid dehalogenase-like hydrolase [Candidatus Lambdaproteobacteria bacterium]
MYTRLVLFDIDGTLLTTNGDAVRAMLRAYERVYGTRPVTDGFLMDGKTELQIVHELLAAAGLDEARVTAGLPRFWASYVAELERRLAPERITVYPGVRPLLAALRARPALLLGLLTGNIEGSARLKLARAGLDGFAVGAYGEHHRDRAALPAQAVAAAQASVGRRFTGKEIVVLGDTPNDVRCGRDLGVTTIAVATGLYSRAALAAEAPDHLFNDLADVPAVLAAIEGRPAGGGAHS